MKSVAVALGIAVLLIAIGKLTFKGEPEVPEPPGPVAPQVWADSLPNDDGRHVRVSWTRDAAKNVVYLVFATTDLSAPPPPAIGGKLISTSDLSPGQRKKFAKAAEAARKGDVGAFLVHAAGLELAGEIVRGRWVLLAKVEDAGAGTVQLPPGTRARFAVMTAREGPPDHYTKLSPPVLSEPVSPKAAWFNRSRWFYLFIVLMMGGALFYYTRRVRRDPKSVYVRRIAGVDAIEDSVGRSTEMGRPVLYVTGVEEIQNIQTIASLLVLGHVAEIVADYDTEMKVANFFPLTMVVAEEIVRQGFANAGRIDAHKPENVMFISAEQFAFAAGVNGLILRDKPATNIYLGRFFAESLILAETGYVTRAVQIAGTAEITQLPFFIAACDYTIIGEELYAVSAYLSREPGLLAMLKSTDFLKVMFLGLVILGAIISTLGGFDLGSFLSTLRGFDLGSFLMP